MDIKKTSFICAMCKKRFRYLVDRNYVAEEYIRAIGFSELLRTKEDVKKAHKPAFCDSCLKKFISERRRK